LQEAGIEPDWIIGASIGAINIGCVINDLASRLPESERSKPEVTALAAE
jgi:predicted acylesterase/phospholipase RssA